MEINLTDIEKTKIDILRDALKDASDTIRALDRKINFLVSYNAVFLGAISTLFFNYKNLSFINNIEIFYCLLVIISLIWIGLFINMMMGIAPKTNPIEIFKNALDQEFAGNVFFVFTNAKKATLELDKLSENFSKIEDYKQIEKLLYKEIGKVSYIRDVKLKSVSRSVTSSWILTVSFIILIGVFGVNSFLGKDIKDSQSFPKSHKVTKILKKDDVNLSSMQAIKEDLNATK